MKFINNIHLKVLLLFILFHKIVNLEEKYYPENITWNGEISNKSDIKQYKINVNANKVNNEKYLKLLLKGNDIFNHYVLSFYQNDSSFTKRYQLFQSYNKEIEMWLSKSQYNDMFYFSIECEEYPCNYNCSINKTENFSIELNLNKIYNYYVTNETKEMNFSFTNNNESFSKNDKLLIWVKGNKNLTVKNETKNSIKNIREIMSENICENEKDINAIAFNTDNTTENIEKKYYVDLLNFSDYNQSEIFNYTLSVSGELGDIINVGAIIFNENNTSNFILEDNIEISGLLKNEYMNKICFKYNGNKSLTFTNHDYVKLKYTEKGNKFCLTLKDENKTEGFFSFYYVNKNTTKNDLYFPKVIGIEQPMRYIRKNDSIQLIISKPTDYFDFFIYNFNTPNNISIEGYFCDSYPFCDNSDSESMKKIKLYESFKDVTFLKSHFNNYSLSLIDKNQIILIISCIKSKINEKREVPGNEGYNISNYCLTDINLYKEISHSQYVYRGESKEDNFTFIYDYSFSYSFLNIELIYGQIHIEILQLSSDDYVYFQHRNNYLYEIQNSSCILSIKSDINTYYHIYYTPLIMTRDSSFSSFTYLYNVEGTYLLRFNEYDNLFSDIFFENNFTNLTKSLLPSDNNSKEDLLLINFCPIKCEIVFEELPQSNLEQMYDSYQSLQHLYYNNITQSFQYSIKKKNDDQKECLFLASVYNLNSTNGSILLSGNVPRKFMFSEGLKSMNFSFYHQKRNCKYIIITLEPNEGIFDVVILSNEVSKKALDYYNETNIGERTEIEIRTNNITNDLEDKNNYERYLIKFQVISKNNQSSYITINVEVGNDVLKRFLYIYNSIILILVISLISAFLFIRFRKRKPKFLFDREESYTIELKKEEEELKENKKESLVNSSQL